MGQSSSTTTQSSSTAPGAAAQPEVQGLLSNLQGLEGNTGLTPAMSGAISQLTAAGQAGNQFAPAIGGVATNLLSGGGATGQVPALQQNLASYNSNLSPYLNPNYSTLSSPAVQAALSQAATDVTGQVNGQFAAAGRSGSASNSMALGRGIAAAQAPIILGQANTDTANRIAAANSAYGAGSATSNAISGLTQQGNANSQAGIGAANDALTATQWGPQQVLAAQQLGQSIPASNLGLLAQIGIPLASLYTNQNGTQNTQGQESTAQEIGQIGTGLGSLFGGGKKS